MATEAAAPERQIADAFERYRSLGLFTHGVAAFGSLERDAPSFVHAHLPDGADVFDLASLTKALVTVPLVFRAVVRDGLSLDSSLATWLGEARTRDLDPRLTRLTVRALLRHESGLPAWRNFWVCHLGVDPPSALADRRAVEARLVEGLNRAADGIASDPKDVYSDVGFLLLGLALERAAGADLATQFESLCREEFGIEAGDLPLAYGPKLDTRYRTVSTAYCALRGRVLQGEVHDENCASLGGITAHAGLFGTAASVARFVSALRVSAVGKALWGANSKARILTPIDPPNEPLMGWRQGAIKSAQTFRDGRAMGHLGFTGTALWIDPETSEYAILLTNRVCNGRIRPEIVTFRREVFGAMNALRA